MAKQTQIAKIGELLVLVGAIVALIFGILMILLPGFSIVPWFLGSLGFLALRIIFGIVTVILALITLATAGAIKFKFKLEKNWIMYLLLGILLLIFGGDIGAVLVIIGAILMLF